MNKTVLYVIAGFGLAIAFPSIIVLLISSMLMSSMTAMVGGGGSGVFISIIGYLSLVGSLFSLVFVPILYNNETFDMAKLVKIIVLVTGLLIVLGVILGIAGEYINFLLFILGLIGGLGVAFFGFKTMGSSSAV
ncbi:MAG: hypothetical protein ACLFST_11270 [Spirochaetia bacterium]